MWKDGNGNPLQWKIPQSVEPGGLESMESQSFGHDWATEHTIVFNPDTSLVEYEGRIKTFQTFKNSEYFRIYFPRKLEADTGSKKWIQQRGGERGLLGAVGGSQRTAVPQVWGVGCLFRSSVRGCRRWPLLERGNLPALEEIGAWRTVWDWIWEEDIKNSKWKTQASD